MKENKHSTQTEVIGKYLDKLKEGEFLVLESQRIAHIGSFVFDLNTLEWSGTDVLDEIFGIGEDYQRDVWGWLELVHPDYRDGINEYFSSQAVSNRQPFNKEYRIIKNDTGEERWVHGIGELKYHDGNNHAFLIGTIQDITSRKNTEIELAKSQKWLNSISQTTNDLFFRLNKEGIIEYVSPKVKFYSGYEESDLLGNHYSIVTSPGEIEKAGKGFKEVLEGNSIENFEINLKTKDGVAYDMEINAGPEIVDGEVTGVQGIIRDITKRKDAEAQIIKERNQAQQYLDVAAVMIAVLDIDGNIIKINKKGCEILGFEESEILHKNWFDLCISDEDKKESRTLFDRVISGEAPLEEYHEKRIVTKSGELKILAFHNSLIKNENEEITGVLFSGEDITVHMLVEEELKNIFNLSPDLICIADLKTLSFKKINPAFWKLLGYQEKDIIGKPFYDFIHPDDIQRTRGVIEGKLLKGEKIENFENRYRTKDGSYKWFEWISQPIPTFGIAYEVAHDITNRKLVEQALKESEERFKFALKDSSITVSNQDKNLKYTWIYNAKSDFPEDNIIGKTDEDLYPKEEAEILTGIKQEVLDTGKSINTKVRFSVDGEITYHQVSIEPMYDAAGELTGISSTSTDVTDLENAKLKAEESDKLKSAFLTNLSHEIRTPMNGIVGFSQLLNEPGISAEKRTQYARIINESGKQLLNIINDIIDISKIESGQIDVNMDKASINEKLNETYSFYKPILSKEEVDLILIKGLVDGEDVVYTDATKLQQIINNLISNAMKFTSQGYIEYGYYIKNNFIEFYVKDTGIGVMPEFQDRIFDRFSQEDSGKSKDLGGTGLGLSISKAYVELLGGEMWLKSKPGLGTTFYFTIPYKPANDKVQEHSPQTEGDPQVDLLENTILIAEDNDMNYLLLEELLVKSKAKLIRASNGQEAVDLCKKLPGIDLVLMDIRMPVMDGYEAIRKIKGYRPGLPIIAQSAFAMLEDERKALDAGSDDYISKPIKKSLLIAKIANLLNK
ncbi:hypothetical protein MNBD_BACTEROID01-1375 [hydrothermal vent metagenome]|uniref:histidine kinase n=1 Tax=hydrothermal vent metagenome TaxID=652676 RepID=A0A3B0UBN6_9ZZZZ